MKVTFTKDGAKKFLSENYLLIAILIGTMLVALSIGPYQNGDTTWEYKAAIGVMKWGIPYTEVWGSLMNQPPLGFYIEALVFKIVGPSITSGTILMTLFGLGSTFLVYLLGRKLYSKPTGLLAAALFALTPWELALSRSFLIDAQCLFFSLLSLYVGLLAIRRGSLKLALLSGGFFAAALLTKNFAVFTLIPLSLFYVYSRPKNPTLVAKQAGLFGLTALFFTFLWYQIILGKGLGYIFHNSDFGDVNYSGVTVTSSFLPRFLWDYGLGAFLVVTVIFSLAMLLPLRKEFRKTIPIDVICLATILSILAVDLILGVGFNLKVPYTSAVKYDYQALPFFCLIAASLVAKGASLVKGTNAESKVNKKFAFLILLASAFLLGGAIASEAYTAHQMATTDYIVYQVTADQTNVGYSFFRYTPLSQYGMLLDLQYLGYAILLSGLLLASWRRLLDFLRSFFKGLFKPMRIWIATKNAQAQMKSNA